MSGLMIGSIVSTIIFVIVILNIEKYISFMNMDITTYKTFTIYSVLNLYICLEFAMILDKLYYEEKNKLANKYSIIFNLLNFILLIGASLITKNQGIIISVTLIPLALFTIYVIIKNSNKFNLKLDILKCIKYDSVELFNNIAFFLIFLFGLSNALEFGEKYATALTFVALITDTQWDTAEAMVTAATIDISKNNFNYKVHRNNAYKFLGILFLTSLVMFGLWSALKTTSNKIVASILRMIMSLLKTPYCTGIGQVCSSIYQFITVSIFFKINYKVDETGNIISRKRMYKSNA